MRILLTGLMTVHWGRLENGNIGNYYITETTVRELHRVFPDSEIVTTLQMTNEFCEREKVKVLPMDLFYSWSDSDLDICFKELGIAEIYNLTGNLISSTPYIEEVMKSDLVLDFSGEMWGDYAELVGKDRFLAVLMKDRVAQLLKKPVVLLAGSQGPFNETGHLKGLASVAVKKFTAVLNREFASVDVLKENGFDISNVKSFTDVAFLFEPSPISEVKDILINDSIVINDRKTVGFILCGFNMLRGPYDAEPRSDDEFIQFAEAVEFIVEELGARVFLMSHQNGFVKSPELKLINGRDYPYAEQLYSVVKKRRKVNINDIILSKGPYTPKQTKAIIGQFDMFVSGRIHAFVAAVSQHVPTVIINRGHGGRSHRNIGFARSVGMKDYVSDPSSADDIKEKLKKCWQNREELRRVLENKIPVVKDTARSMFDALRELIGK
jgi:colanic acid/amylovoran biosynthesis protein